MDLPEWVQTEEVYQPDRDRDYFISRSLLRVLAVLLSIRQQAYVKMRHCFSAVGVLGFLLGWLLLCVAAHTTAFLCCQLALVLVLSCFLSGRAIRQILQGAMVAMFFSLLLVLPALWLGSGGTVLLLPFKTFLTVSSLALLRQYLPWNKLTQALCFFRVPQEVIFILDTTLRYVALLGEMAGDMLIALKLRSVGRNQRKQQALGSILGRLFLRSQEMSQAMYEAMVCRGFTGEYSSVESGKLQRADIMLCLLCILYMYLFLQLEVGF
ncbi:MAG: energy-coupling factor transporter transmembrane protein EcfT [Selenomonas sp.]|uniref:energy-coupling factor transporter transmembrane component T n=1 Tax=Selenomonas sp. TaxID=2053611 RepID=UPI0025FDEFD1|nr:energy-coupling factor transporter transmembrane component T [Selenomonas sp.]MCR5756541.1 energy-coupling factor transporter transmembrane protein EcfT [Selenomonas sp.]